MQKMALLAGLAPLAGIRLTSAESDSSCRFGSSLQLLGKLVQKMAPLAGLAPLTGIRLTSAEYSFKWSQKVTCKWSRI